MGYGLIWIEALSILLLFAATLATWGAQRQKRWVRGLVTGLGWTLPLFPLCVAILWSILPLMFGYGSRVWLLWMTVMLVCYLMGVLLIRQAGRRKDVATGEARILSWRVSRIAVALLVAALVGLMTLWNMDVQAQLAIQSTRTEAGAMVVSVAPPHIPDQQNAALVYEQAFALLPPKDQWDKLTALEEKVDPLSPEVQSLLQDQAKTIDLLRRAADMPGCRFEFDYVHPDMAAVMSELPGLRKGALLLACAARSKAAHGDVPGALEDCSRMYRIAQHAATNPSIITHLVQMGIRHLADNVVAQVLPRVADAQQLRFLEGQGPDDSARVAHRSLRGEEAWGLATICDWAAGSDPTSILPEADGAGLPGRLPSTGMFGRIFLLRSEVHEYTVAFRRMAAQVGVPYYQAMAQRGKSQEPTPEGWMVRILMPSLERYAISMARTQAVGECRRIAIAATLYRLEHHGYPTDATQLVPKYLPALPVDPFDGKPIRVKATDGGLVIYSIGDDGKDDGGAIQGEDRKAVDYGLLLANRP